MSMISSNHVFLLWELSLCFQNCKFFLVTRIQFPVEKLRFFPLQSQYKKWRPWIVPHTKKSANTSDRKTSQVVPEDGINILMSLKGGGLAILTRSHWNAGLYPERSIARFSQFEMKCRTTLMTGRQMRGQIIVIRDEKYMLELNILWSKEFEP